MKFCQLPDDILNIIYELHHVHFIYHKENLKCLHKELLSNFTCIVCNGKKDFHYDNYCSSACEWEATKYDYYDEEEYTDIEEEKYKMQLYDDDDYELGEYYYRYR
jgi:heterodisulfide reductase subunit A-like polyferredoxin